MAALDVTLWPLRNTVTQRASLNPKGIIFPNIISAQLDNDFITVLFHVCVFSLTELMRKLLTHDGDGGAEAGEDRDGEGGADGQAVDEVVKGVAESDHPRQGLHAPQPRTATPRWRRLYRQSGGEKDKARKRD